MVRIPCHEGARQQQVVPHPEELEDGQRGEGGRGQRQREGSEDLLMGCAVDACGVEQRPGQLSD